MARLFIPQIGNELKLTANWDCKVFNEYRNSKIFDGLNIDVSGADRQNTNIDITFPKGTVLKVSRLYVRAPASSYDSITFSIVSCPIKALNKARFWVKLMDANKIEFEENVIGMDSYKKLKDLHRFVALKNSYQNSENLSPKEEVLVNKEIYDYFSKKQNNALAMKFEINAEEFANTIRFESYRGYHTQTHQNQNFEKALSLVENKFNNLEINLHMLPVLDGWIMYFEENQTAIEIDKELGIYDKEDNGYWRQTYRLGSYLSYDNYHYCADKKEIPKILAIRVEQNKLDEVSFNYQDKKIDFKDKKDFEKFLKSIRVKVGK